MSCNIKYELNGMIRHANFDQPGGENSNLVLLPFTSLKTIPNTGQLLNGKKKNYPSIYLMGLIIRH